MSIALHQPRFAHVPILQHLAEKAMLYATRTSPSASMLKNLLRRMLVEFREMSVYFLAALVLVLAEGIRGGLQKMRCKKTPGNPQKSVAKLREDTSPLETKLHIADLNLWSVTHFTLFTIIGFVFPNYLVTSITVGILWELIELLISKANGVLSPNSAFWYARLSDVLVNTCGALFGAGLNRLLLPA